MNRRELLSFLKDRGFGPKRNGSKHEIYSNGKDDITIPRGSRLNPGLIRHIKCQARRATKGEIMEKPFNQIILRKANGAERKTTFTATPNQPKYSIEERKRLHDRIRELQAAGHKAPQIHKIMHMEGWKSPAGTEFKQFHVTNAMTQIRKLSKPTQLELPDTSSQFPVPKAKPKAQSLPAFVLEILTSPEFSDAKKVRLLLAYADD